MDLFHRIDLTGIDAMRGAKMLGKRQLVVIQIDHDNRVGTGVGSGLHGRETHAADAEHRHGFPRLHLGRVEHRSGSGQNSAADDTGDICRHIFGNPHHIALVNQRVLRPGIDRGTLECQAATAPSDRR